MIGGRHHTSGGVRRILTVSGGRWGGCTNVLFWRGDTDGKCMGPTSYINCSAGVDSGALSGVRSSCLAKDQGQGSEYKCNYKQAKIGLDYSFLCVARGCHQGQADRGYCFRACLF